MPRRPRVELAGYHHVINRGVNRSNIFEDDHDYEMFLTIVCKACRAYKVILHDYCLMSNHFHLLVETELENLSLFMKHINSNYAIYFNKKMKRTGHLWQGRFYSRFITSDEYYYMLIRYIEQNPIEANLAVEVGEYPYTLASVIVNRQKPVACTKSSRLVKELCFENIQEIIGVKLGKEEFEILKELEKQKVVSKDKKHRPAYHKTLTRHLEVCDTKEERNSGIIEALEDGYTQAEIAKHLGLSRSLISKIVKSKSGDSTPDP